MPIETKVWKHEDGKLKELAQSAPDTENQLEDWIAADATIISPDLLLIGRQVQTKYGGVVDFLGIDSEGNPVVIELKRDKTPRDVVAQALDYASWIRQMSREEVEEIATNYLGQSLESAFSSMFSSPLPDFINESHRIIIVAAKLDAASERIVRYLSEEYQVGINVVFFSCFRDNEGNLFIGRSWLMEPEEVEDRASDRTKRRMKLTLEQLRELAINNGVEKIYDHLVENLAPLADRIRRTKSNLAFVIEFEGSRKAFLSIYPGDSAEIKGLKSEVRPELIARGFSIDLERVKEALPGPGDRGMHADVHYFRSKDEVDRLILLLKEAHVG